MKAYICNPNVSTHVDGTLWDQILKHFSLAPTEHHADVTLVPVVYHPNFVFSQELYTLKKPVVLLDYTEYGWDWSGTENVLGKCNIWKYGHLNQPGYRELSEWAKNTKFLVHFKRELLRKDVSENLLPCEFACYHAPYRIQTKEEFLNRPIEVMHHWGYSNDLRRKLHGEIFSKAQECGYNVIDHYNDEPVKGEKTWATFHAPHYRRWRQEDVLGMSSASKIMTSLPGAGIKCFRHAEAPVMSVMALPYDDLAWSYPWIHGYNCVRVRGSNMVEDLQSQLNESLYQTYLAGQETIDLYRNENYVKNYLIQNIKDRL